MTQKAWILGLSFGLLVGACDRDEGTQPKLDAEALEGCKTSCDRLKMFECLDAQMHESCFDACAMASVAEAERFERCADANICDVECFTRFVDEAEEDDGGEGGDDDPVVPADCTSRCAAKAQECAAPPEISQAACEELCADGSGFSQSQLECLEGAECAALAEVLEQSGSVCGIGGDDDGNTPDGDDGNPGASAEIGDACSCPDGGSDWQQCSGTSGPCGPDLTCYVISGEGICSVPCEPGSCTVGECTDHIVQGLEVGRWCVP